MTDRDTGSTGGPDSEPNKPDLRKQTPQQSHPGQSDSGESGSGRSTPEPLAPEPPVELGRTYDYDTTAQASLSAQSPTPDSFSGGPGTPGPGWDTYSGVGNGPGWGNAPSYPPPTEHQSDYPPPSDYPYEEQSMPQYGTGPVYGTPDPKYPTGPAQGTGAGHTSNAPGPAGHAQAPGYTGPPSGYGPAPFYGHLDPAAPYGRDPYTGEAFSDKSKATAGVLQIVLGPFGAGRFYMGQPGIAIAQIAVSWLTCGVGVIWPVIDGILMLTGKVRDESGRPLRP